MRERVLRNQVPSCCCGDLDYVLEPIVRLADQEIVGHELLARPVSGEGFVSWSQRQGPAVHGLVADALLRQLAGADLPPGLVFVNVTATDLERRGFSGAVIASATPELRARLVVEVTEARPIADVAALVGTLRDLRAAGIRVAVDDFGEGWSNFNAVETIRPEVLKVALPLVDGALGAWVVRMATNLQASTVAERIERTTDLELAQARGFTYGQGFLWAHRPVPPVLAACGHRSGDRWGEGSRQRRRNRRNRRASTDR